MLFKNRLTPENNNIEVKPSLSELAGKPNVPPKVKSSLRDLLSEYLSKPIVRGSHSVPTLPHQVIFMRGSQDIYEQLEEKNSDALQFVSKEGEDTGSLYLGDMLIASNVSAETSLEDLSDVIIGLDIEPDHILSYNNDGTWTNKSFMEVAKPFTAPSNVNPGAPGLVPAPPAAAQNKFLKGNGTWSYIQKSDLPIEFTPITNEEIDAICQ